MAINQNHIVEELEGIKCAIVEKNVSPMRAEFLKKLLYYNHYTVVVVASPPPKSAPAKSLTDEVVEAPPAAPIVETYTVGVTDLMFNATNAIFGRLLHAPEGHIVTLAYWHQKEKVPSDEVPYFVTNL